MNANNIDAYKLIRAVKKRPALYDKEDKMYYCHNKFKQRLWKETCEEVYPNWDLMSHQNRIESGRELQKRWKNLRTCFTRELKLQKRENKDRKEGREVKPRKKYEYFDRLLFLLQEDQKVKLESSETVNEDDLDNMKAEFLEYDDDENGIIVETGEENLGRKSPDVNSDDKVNGNDDDGEDDKHFLMSLLGTFRQLNDKQKFDAKIEILGVLRKIQFPED